MSEVILLNSPRSSISTRQYLSLLDRHANINELLELSDSSNIGVDARELYRIYNARLETGIQRGNEFEGMKELVENLLLLEPMEKTNIYALEAEEENISLVTDSEHRYVGHIYLQNN